MKKILVVIFLSVIIANGWFGWQVFKSNDFKNIETVNIEPGIAMADIAKALKLKKIIDNEFVFYWYAKLTKADRKLIAGSHQLEPGSSVKEILRQLQTKTAFTEKSITLIEGWKLDDIAKYLSDKGIVSQDEFLKASKIENWRSRYDFLADKKIKTLEGFIFPDTYRIFADAKADDIIEKALDNFENKVNGQIRRDIEASGRSLYDALILASIIEREALYDEDRFMISDIFLKRIDAGIGLQSDATINYVTGKKTSRPSYADLRVDSPYNTYKYRGLPPGPISNPGLASIKASAYPKSNPYYYFLTDAEGRAYFGRTYDDHLNNIKKHLD